MHDVVHRHVPGARVAYVDNDPVVLTHGRALIARPACIVVRADIRHPEQILENAEIRTHLDFTQPIALLMFSILHHVRDDENPAAITAAFRDAVCPGSYLALAHFHDPGASAPEVSAGVKQYERIFNETLGTGRWRPTEEIKSYFGDFEMVDPGLVSIFDWRPDETVPEVSDEMRLVFSGGIARKR
jgi:hypothetical protein